MVRKSDKVIDAHHGAIVGHSADGKLQSTNQEYHRIRALVQPLKHYVGAIAIMVGF